MSARRFSLQPFPGAGLSSPLGLAGCIDRTSNTLAIEYVLRGPLSDLVIPESAREPERKDRLWEHTCFELFLAPTGSPRYWEFNLSPAGHWNAYRFSAYRKEMAVEGAFASLPLAVRSRPDALSVRLELDLGGIIEAGQDLEASVTAVLKHSDGRLTFWALTHCRPQADFHCRESFIVQLCVGAKKSQARGLAGGN